MLVRLLRWGATATAMTAVALTGAVRVNGQGQTAASAKAKAKPGTFVVGRTSWGDPDLQGNFTNKAEQGTPFERPAEFDGRRIEDIQGAELVEILRKRQDRIVANARPEGDAEPHAPVWWSDRYDITKGGRPWFVVDPPDGKIPPMTAAAEKRIAARARSGRGPADSYEDRSLYDRCVSRGLPGSMLPTIYGDSYQILQGPGYVAIRYEMIHETRIIPLDTRPHLSSTIREYMGDARGHWDGNTLVVETTNFRESSTYRNANADTLRLVERFTRTAPNRVEWSVTVDDPATWTRPWTFSIPLTADDSEPIFEYGCHEGNYGLRNILSGARVEEKAAAEDAKNGIKRVAAPISKDEESER
jgi:hypothetical protein